MKLLLTDAELLIYVRDIQKGLIPFIDKELSTLNINTAESIT